LPEPEIDIHHFFPLFCIVFTILFKGLHCICLPSISSTGNVKAFTLFREHARNVNKTSWRRITMALTFYIEEKIKKSKPRETYYFSKCCEVLLEKNFSTSSINRRTAWRKDLCCPLKPEWAARSAVPKMILLFLPELRGLHHIWNKRETLHQKNPIDVHN